MTLSNFDWTDKTSVKWFIMLPTGHEGPYSLDALMRRKISPEMKVWAEGLPSPVFLKNAFKNSQEVIVPVMEVDELPPLPQEEAEEDFIPPIPVSEMDLEMEEVQEVDVPIINPQTKVRFVVGFAVLVIVIFGLKQWVSSQEKFVIRRATGMSPELFQKITSDFKFEGWNKKIFFKEYVPADMSHIWLVNTSFHNCQVDALFSSVKGKLLAAVDEKVIFRTSTQLQNHIAEFSNFEFTAGNKIIPGLYEMDLKATGCTWDGLGAKMGNLFKSPDEVYVTRMKLVLYHKGNVEFNAILDKLIRKKIQIELKNQNQEELFWQDLQEKLQTLLAISLQIEQLLLEFVESPVEGYNKNLKIIVEKYMKNHGRFLTEFVIANEKYFLDLEDSDLSNMSKKRNYEKVIKITSKNIGLESMKIIEQLQSWKKPTLEDLGRMQTKIKTQFEGLKTTLNHKILQVSEDRLK